MKKLIAACAAALFLASARAEAQTNISITKFAILTPTNYPAYTEVRLYAPIYPNRTTYFQYSTNLADWVNLGGGSFANQPGGIMSVDVFFLKEAYPRLFFRTIAP